MVASLREQHGDCGEHNENKSYRGPAFSLRRTRTRLGVKAGAVEEEGNGRSASSY